VHKAGDVVFADVSGEFCSIILKRKNGFELRSLWMSAIATKTNSFHQIMKRTNTLKYYRLRLVSGTEKWAVKLGRESTV
jgi:hypothetical protein